jgi:hypothetical protein
VVQGICYICVVYIGISMYVWVRVYDIYIYICVIQGTGLMCGIGYMIYMCGTVYSMYVVHSTVCMCGTGYSMYVWYWPNDLYT